MSAVLKRPAPLSVLALAALLAMLMGPATAFADDGDGPIFIFTHDSTCAGQKEAKKLSDELLIRLPKAQFLHAQQESPSDSSWTITWTSERGADSTGCQILIQKRARQTSFELDRDADDEAYRFVASRVAWFVTVDPDDEEGGLFGPIVEEQTDDEQADVIDDEALKQEASALAAQLATSAQQRARHTIASIQPRRAAADRAEHTSLQARQIAQQANHKLATSPPPQPPGRLRLSLLPSVIIVGDDLAYPRQSINFIGANPGFAGLEMGLLNIVDVHGRGVQFGVAGNWVRGSLYGAQFSFGLNGAHVLRGAQLTTGVNLSTHDARGLQMAILLNSADSGAGLQLSPVANIVARSWRGAQIGLLNVADDIKGAQIGLINLSRSAAAPIGLVNFAADFPPRLFAWISLPGHTFIALQTGGRLLRYGLIYGHRFSPEGDRHRAFGFSVGLHLPRGRLFFDADLAILANFNDPSRIFTTRPPIQQLKLITGWRLLSHLAPIAGISITRMTDGDFNNFPRPLSLKNAILWPELVLGISF